METPPDLPEHVIPRPDDAGPATAPQGTFCRHCGYDVSSLPFGGACPECGAEIVEAAADLLSHASPAYLNTLSRGLVIVIIALITQAALKLSTVALHVLMPFLAMNGATSPRLFHIVTASTAIADVLVMLLALSGWWLFSQPDPGYTGRNDGSKARTMLRVTLVAAAAFSVVSAAMTILSPIIFNFTGPGVGANTNTKPNAIALVALILIWLLSTGVWVARFLASILYIRWLARRAGDQRIVSQCRLYIWLLPLIYVVGYLCINLGPLASCIILITFLFQVRAMIDEARRQTPAAS